MPCRARIFEFRSQSRAMTSDVHDSSGQTGTCADAGGMDWHGLVLMCMKPRAFSYESVAYVDTRDYVRNAPARGKCRLERYLHEVHGTLCRRSLSARASRTP